MRPTAGLSVLGAPPPRSDLSLAPTGTVAQTYARNGARMVNVATLTSGQLYLAAIYIPAGTVVTNISWKSATQAAVAPTNWWFGLYDNARLGLKLTADQTSTAWAANTTKTVALSSTYTATYSGLYYVSIMMAAGTAVSLFAVDVTGTGPPADVPILCGNSTSGLTGIPTPGTAGGVGGTAGAIAVQSSYPYAWLT